MRSIHIYIHTYIDWYFNFILTLTHADIRCECMCMRRLMILMLHAVITVTAAAAPAECSCHGKRTMPIEDELADSNTIDFCFWCLYQFLYDCMCMYACMLVYTMNYASRSSMPRLRRLEFNASYWDRWYLCNGDCGEDLPFRYQRFILGPLVSL